MNNLKKSIGKKLMDFFYICIMISFKANKNIEILIPAGWHEVNLDQAIALETETDPQKIVKILSGSDVENFEYIFTFLNWITEPIDMDHLQGSNELKLQNDTIILKEIKTYSWAQKILFNEMLKESDKTMMLKNVAGLISIYVYPIFSGEKFNYDDALKFSEKIKSCNFLESINFLKNILNQIEEILQAEKKIPSNPATPEMISAGVKMFDQLGIMSVVDMISGGDVTKYDQVLEIEYSVIYQKLLKIGITSVYEKKYKEILKDSKK